MMMSMSPKDKKLSRKLVEEYWRNNQKLPRSELRRLIRLETKITDDKTKLRKLDRYLKKIFDEDRRLRAKLEKLSWIGSYLRLTDLIETKEDHQMLLDLIEKLEKKKRVKEEQEEQQERSEILKKNKNLTEKKFRNANST
jgi:hypothetical protein